MQSEESPSIEIRFLYAWSAVQLCFVFWNSSVSEGALREWSTRALKTEILLRWAQSLTRPRSLNKNGGVFRWWLRPLFKSKCPTWKDSYELTVQTEKERDLSIHSTNIHLFNKHLIQYLLHAWLDARYAGKQKIIYVLILVGSPGNTSY